MKGAELGIASMAAALVLAVGTAVQWMQRTDSASSEEHAGLLGSIAGFGRSLVTTEGGHAEEPFVAPVVRKWTTEIGRAHV